ncbi:MAG: translation initiation factor 2 [Oscillospiraceae bacterium]|nr:translation initiation factor 2 [Oscillospiraceae bacterium]
MSKNMIETGSVIIMVKGITRRVIVIKSPDRRLFEEAIFIVREDALTEPGVTPDDIIKEAQDVADNYIRSNLKPKRLKLPPSVFALLGAGVTGAIWLLAWMFW